ncbi:MAG: DUF4258 domain-containing protein [Flavobacteriaceae bacterium]|nr:DUF4258 domain-containing protein [Flavobacteriaceae bacterium]
MDLKKRFFLYGFGFAIGALVVLFIWNKKDASFDYMPDARVLKNIQSKTVKTSNSAYLILIAHQIDSLSLSNMIKNGDVDFKKSNTETKPCKTYWINTSFNEEKWSLIIQNCDSIATIQKVIKE